MEFILDLWPCILNINRGHLLARGIPYTIFRIFPANGSRDFEWGFWVEILTLTFEAFTVPSLVLSGKGSKDIEQKTFVQRPAVWSLPLTIRPEIYLLRATTVLSLAINFPAKGQKILSQHRLVNRLTDQ